jgi:hypothetical protein
MDDGAGSGSRADASRPEPGTTVAGAPPWAGEPVTRAPDSPPPWESGPWPGPGGSDSDEAGPARPDEAGGTRPDSREPGGPGSNGQSPDGHGGDLQDSDWQGSELQDPAGQGSAGRDAAGRDAERQGAKEQGADARSVGRNGPGRQAVGNPLSTAALIAGIAGIAVLPGLILGVLGLRRARVTGTGRVQSGAGIALSLLWAAAIVAVVVLTGQGSSTDVGCSGYQAAGRAAPARASTALSAGAARSQLRADLSQAASSLNTAAASAQDVSVRNALSELTGDLQSALDQVTAGRPVPAALKRTLSRDAAAASRVCGGPAA